MLPIDDAAKSGAWVWCRHPLRAVLHYVRFSGSGWWDGDRTYPESFFHEYIPGPYVEHAGAMREALIHADAQAAAASEIANVIYDSDVVDEALAATEWPGKEG